MSDQKDKKTTKYQLQKQMTKELDTYKMTYEKDN